MRRKREAEERNRCEKERKERQEMEGCTFQPNIDKPGNEGSQHFYNNIRKINGDVRELTTMDQIMKY